MIFMYCCKRILVYLDTHRDMVFEWFNFPILFYESSTVKNILILCYLVQYNIQYTLDRFCNQVAQLWNILRNWEIVICNNLTFSLLFIHLSFQTWLYMFHFNSKNIYFNQIN